MGELWRCGADRAQPSQKGRRPSRRVSEDEPIQLAGARQSPTEAHPQIMSPIARRHRQERKAATRSAGHVDHSTFGAPRVHCAGSSAIRKSGTHRRRADLRVHGQGTRRASRSVDSRVRAQPHWDTSGMVWRLGSSGDVIVPAGAGARGGPFTEQAPGIARDFLELASKRDTRSIGGAWYSYALRCGGIDLMPNTGSKRLWCTADGGRRAQHRTAGSGQQRRDTCEGQLEILEARALQK